MQNDFLRVSFTENVWISVSKSSDAAIQENGSSAIIEQRKVKSACASTQFDQGPLCSSIYCVASNYSISG